MAAEKKTCALCGRKNVMHYADRTVERHLTPDKNVYCKRKTY